MKDRCLWWWENPLRSFPVDFVRNLFTYPNLQCSFVWVPWCLPQTIQSIRAMRKGKQMIVERELRQKRKLRGKKGKMKLKEIHFEHVILLDRKTIYLKLEKDLPSGFLFQCIPPMLRRYISLGFPFEHTGSHAHAHATIERCRPWMPLFSVSKCKKRL